MLAHVLRAEGLSKTYLSPAGKVNALSRFSHTFTPGQITAIMGPSGSGKSTLLNLLAGIDIPSEGRVWLQDKELSTLSEGERADLRLRHIGFVFQAFNLIAVLSAQKNVAFPLGLAGQRKAERTARAATLLENLGLGHRLNHLPFKLSGGEKQRVALARALANDPAVIFADEPTGNLDSVSGKTVLDALRRTADEGRVVVIVTHDPAVAERADGVVQLKDGRKVGDGLR